MPIFREDQEGGTTMDRGTLSVLEADVRAQLAEIEGIYERIEEREEGFERDAIRLESLSYQLHNLFGAFEDLFEIIAAFFENSIGDRSRWHIELLKRMREDIEGIRPALLSEESFLLLDELRAFRHFFRHAYASRLESEKVRIVLNKTMRLRKSYQGEVERFFAAVTQM